MQGLDGLVIFCRESSDRSRWQCVENPILNHFLESTMTFGNLHEGRYVFHLNAIRRSGIEVHPAWTGGWISRCGHVPSQIFLTNSRTWFTDHTGKTRWWRGVFEGDCWWWHLPHRIVGKVGTVWPQDEADNMWKQQWVLRNAVQHHGWQVWRQVLYLTLP